MKCIGCEEDFQEIPLNHEESSINSDSVCAWCYNEVKLSHWGEPPSGRIINPLAIEYIKTNGQATPIYA